MSDLAAIFCFLLFVAGLASWVQWDEEKRDNTRMK